MGMNSADGSGLRVLCPVIILGRRPKAASITPAGRWVIFGSDGQLWKVSIDGGTPISLANLEADCPAVSPNGTRVAFRLQDAFGVMPSAANRYSGSRTHPHLVLERPLERERNGPAAQLRTERPLQHLAAAARWIAAAKITQFDDDYVLGFDVSPDGRILAVVRSTLSRDAVLIENFR